MPALLTPGIREKIWKIPINIIDRKFKFEEIFLSNRFLSEMYKIIANIKVVQDMNNKSLKTKIKPELKIKNPNKINRNHTKNIKEARSLFFKK